ncbi:MAG: hypothetical protein RL490_169 [Pseudomonadota bacterium]|jgi:nitrate reductase gamma subunit
MAMMEATHAAAGLAGGFLTVLFVAGVAIFLWARRR